jgi:GNAT superfamily N-acetyltransferase
MTDRALAVSHLRPAEGSEVRDFCLATIREAFGYDYRPDWHADIDELRLPVNGYHPDRGGAFLVVRQDGAMIGCGGLRCLTTSQHLAARFAPRYGDPAAIGAIWRVYVDPHWRGAGIGSLLATRLGQEAGAIGYDRLYLHTSANTPRSVAFWERQGYEAFDYDGESVDSTVHMDKDVTPAAQPELSGLRALRSRAR